MTETTVSDAPAEFICPIRLQIMKDPVMSKFGQNYERQAIMEWLLRGNYNCPITRKPLKSSDIVPNNSLRVQICNWEDCNRYQESDDEEDEGETNKRLAIVTLNDGSCKNHPLNTSPTLRFQSCGNFDDDLECLLDLYTDIVELKQR